MASSVDEWWELDRANLNAGLKRDFDGLIIYTLWNERYHRIFSHDEREEESVAFICHKDYDQVFRLAVRPAVVDIQ